jgi:formate hydrogenlyase transcriptional activator
MGLETQRQSDKVRIQQYQTLLEISEAIASNRDLASLFRNLAQHLRAVVDFDWVSTLLYDPARDVMRIHMLEPPQPEGLIGPAEMPVDDVPSGWAWKTQEPLIIQDAARETRYPQFNKWARQNGVKSYCALPLTSAGRRLGALGFASVKNVVWNDDDLEFLTQVARQVAVAVDNAINFESVRSAERRAARDRDHSQLLLEINNAVASHLNLGELLRAITPCLRKVIYHDFAGLALYDAESRQLRAHALDFPKDKDVLEEGVVFSMEGTPSGVAFTSRRTVIVGNLEQERFASTPLVKILRAEGVKSGCSVPLIAHGEAVGVLTLMSLREEAFSEADADLLTQIGGQIALAVENALSFDRARQAERRAARERDRIRLLLDINNAIVSHLELGTLVKKISASLLGILPHEAAGIALYEPEHNLLREYENVAYEGFVAFQKGMAMPLEGTPAGLVFTSGQPLLLKRPDPERFPVDPGQRPINGSRNSACLAPLISHGRKLGILGVGSAQEDRFTEEDLELLTQVADQVAIAVENSVNFERAREAERELERKLDHLRLMLRVTNTVVSRLNLQELLDVISATICEEMGCDTAGVGLYDHKSEQLIAFSTQFPPGHPFRDKGISIPLEGTPGGLAFTTGQPVFLDKPDPERFNSHYSRRILEDGYRSGGSIPLIAQGRKLGVLGVASKRENSLSDDDRELLVQVANQVAIAVDNALNFERARAAELEVKRQYDRLRLMLEINNAIVSRLDLRDLISVTAACLREVLHHDIAGLSLYDPDTNQLRAYAYDFPDKQFVIPEGTPVPLKGSLGGKAFTSGQSVFTNRPGSEDAVSDFNKRFTELGVKSGGCVPLIVHGRKLGVLGVASLREDAFPEDQQELLAQVAAQIAIAVDNALNFERARKAEQEARRHFDHLGLVLRINNAVVSQLDLHELLQVISGSLREMVRNDTTGIALYEPESDKLRLVMTDFPEQMELVEERYLVPLEGAVMGLAFTSGEPVFLDEYDLERFPSDFTRRSYDAGLRSCGNIPLIAHGRKLGALGVASKRPNAFSAEDVELLCQCANQIAIAVENALNFERARVAEQQAKRQSDRLQLLLNLNNAIASALDPPALFRAVSASLRQVFQHDFAILGLYDEQKKELGAYAIDSADGLNLFEEGMLIPIEGTPAELAVATKRAVIIGPGDAQKYSSEMVRRSVEQGLRSSCTAPLLRHNRVIGVMTIASKREAVFTPDDGELFLQIAGQIAIAVENALAYREIDALKNKLASEKLYLEDEIRTEHNFEELIGASQSFKRILKQIETVAPTDSTVLIRGETGTGKELIARAIHSLSGRNERTLVKINCAAIPTGLLESELFGHEKGAFTGAIAQRVGRFELAHKGTLFLDEVGDIPFELQPKLLRVLQEQEFERLGSARTQKVDVRLIAATNADLEQLVADRKYRSDLYYRLNVFPITIPPLRERTEDIPALTRFFTQKYARRLKKRIEAIPAEVMTAITNYRWPGNVRELEHFIERAVVLTPGPELEVSLSELKSSAPAVPVMISTLEDAERGHIIRTLDETNWVIGGPNGAAARLGMKRTTLQSKMQKLGISRSK